MYNQPVQLNQLDIIGFAESLPNGRGPAVVPPIFRDRKEPNLCFVPPFRIAGSWIIDPQRVTFDEVVGWAQAEQATLPNAFSVPAKPEYQLWVDEQGKVRYEYASEAKQNLNAIYQNHKSASEVALIDGKFCEAEKLAGIALAANDRALEPHAVIAACCVLRGEVKQALFMKQVAEAMGHNGISFEILLKNYAESISEIVQEGLSWKKVWEACEGLGVEVCRSFIINEDDFCKLRPLLHRYNRSEKGGNVIISCSGIEAELMMNRQIILTTYAESESWIKDKLRTEVMMVAAETMLYESELIAVRWHSTDAEIRQLGEMARNQLRWQFIAA